MIKSADIKSITVEHKGKRLDGAFDLRLKITGKDGAVFYAPLRLDAQVATSFYFVEKAGRRQPKFVSLPRTRTVKGSFKALFSKHPEILATSSQGLSYTLEQDDREARRRRELSRRKWRIHQVARWAGGFFVLRLSCSRIDRYDTRHTQFILYPGYGEICDYPTPGQLWKVYCQHGSWNTTVKVDAMAVYRAMHSKAHWPTLSQALNEIEYGYSTELEAISGVEHVVAQQATAPRQNFSTGTTNFIRQPRTNTEIPVTILDSYQAEHEFAWLFESADGHYIMRTDRGTPGKVSLLEHGVSTVLSDPIETAQRLLTQSGARISGWRKDRAQGLNDWRRLISQDARHRHFTQNLTAHWQITRIAGQGGVATSVMAICLPAPTLALPAAFTPLAYRVLSAKDGKLLDPSSPKHPFYRFSTETLTGPLTRLLADPGNNRLRDDLQEILAETLGYPCEQQALAVWQKLTRGDQQHVIDGQACPLPEKLQIARYRHSVAVKRQRLVSSLNESGGDDSRLAVFEQASEDRQKYPLQLIEYGISQGWVSPQQAKKIAITDCKYRNELVVDLFASVPNIPASGLTAEPGETQIKSSPLPRPSVSEPVVAVENDAIPPAEIAPTQRPGRKRIYVNDQEKKRIWAREKRAKIKAEQESAGAEPGKPGRQKEYASNAERQKAHRFRCKWTTRAAGATLLIIDVQDNLAPKPALVEDLTRVIPYYGQHVHGTVTTGYHLSGKNTTGQLPGDGESAALALPPGLISADRLYLKENLGLEQACIEQLKAGGHDRIHLCGIGLVDRIYSVAMALFTAGIQPVILKELCQGGKKEVSLAINLYRQHFGKTSVI